MKIDDENLVPLKKSVKEIKVLHSTKRTNEQFLKEMKEKGAEIGTLKKRGTATG